MNKQKHQAVIALNKKATHDYFLEQRVEAGIVLEGWEVKSAREGRVQIAESHVIIKQGEAFLLNAVITPLKTVSTHVVASPSRTRKLLLHAKELRSLIGKVERKAYTLVPGKMYWKSRRIKLEIALAKGKKQFDKRATIREREWSRIQERLLRQK